MSIHSTCSPEVNIPSCYSKPNTSAYFILSDAWDQLNTRLAVSIHPFLSTLGPPSLNLAIAYSSGSSPEPESTDHINRVTGAKRSGERQIAPSTDLHNSAAHSPLISYFPVFQFSDISNGKKINTRLKLPRVHYNG